MGQTSPPDEIRRLHERIDALMGSMLLLCVAYVILAVWCYEWAAGKP